MQFFPTVEHTCGDINRLIIGSIILGVNSGFTMHSNDIIKTSSALFFMSYIVWAVSSVLLHPLFYTCGNQHVLSVDTLPYVLSFAGLGQIIGIFTPLLCNMATDIFRNDPNSEEDKSASEVSPDDESDSPISSTNIPINSNNSPISSNNSPINSTNIPDKPGESPGESPGDSSGEEN